MGAEKIEPVASFSQVHDPRLGVLQFQADSARITRKRRKGVPGFVFDLTSPAARPGTERVRGCRTLPKPVRVRSTGRRRVGQNALPHA
jgi:hypothetical protein